MCLSPCEDLVHVIESHSIEEFTIRIMNKFTRTCTEVADTDRETDTRRMYANTKTNQDCQWPRIIKIRR